MELSLVCEEVALSRSIFHSGPDFKSLSAWTSGVPLPQLPKSISHVSQEYICVLCSVCCSQLLSSYARCNKLAYNICKIVTVFDGAACKFDSRIWFAGRRRREGGKLFALLLFLLLLFM
jgi:hypothetical protein